ncbi:(Fe-S)-binding protein [Geomonas sp. Red276]
MTRLNRFPQGAPSSELLFKIFSILFTEADASLLSRLPLRPFTVTRAARIWNVGEREAEATLEGFASRAMLLDVEREGKTLYILPPPMAGFFEFSLMRFRADIDQKELAGLFFQYINVEEEFVRDLFAGGETSIGRVLVNEPALSPEEFSHVLDYERASEVIRSASDLAVGLCYCRHKMAHQGRACQAPLDNCMTLNLAAASLIRNGIAKRIDTAQGLELLEQAREHNLIQCADNVQRGVNFICHCCGCCCEGLLAVKRLTLPNSMYTTNFIQRTDLARCTGCGQCARICPIDAIAMAPASPPLQGEGQGEDGVYSRRPSPKLAEEFCLGCGICVKNCPAGAISLVAREKRALTPINTAHRLVMMAIERGKLQNLIFDNQADFSHRALAAILGAVLRLPPVKRALATRQFKSRFLEKVMSHVEIDSFSK